MPADRMGEAMKIVGLMPVRNEDWCLGLTARAALKVVDHLIIFDHASTDRTPEIAQEITADGPATIRSCTIAKKIRPGARWHTDSGCSTPPGALARPIS